MSHLWYSITTCQSHNHTSAAKTDFPTEQTDVCVGVVCMQRRELLDWTGMPVQQLIQAGFRSAAAKCLSLLLPQRAANSEKVFVTAVDCPFLITLCQIFSWVYLNAIIIPLHKDFIYSCSIYISNTYEGPRCVQIEKDSMFADSKMKEIQSE